MHRTRLTTAATLVRRQPVYTVAVYEFLQICFAFRRTTPPFIGMMLVLVLPASTTTQSCSTGNQPSRRRPIRRGYLEWFSFCSFNRLQFCINV
jgi:hypothetical protein